MLATVLMLLVAFQDATTYKISISPITVTVETVTTPAPDPEPEIPTPLVGPPEVVPDPNAGWTVLTPSADSRMIYVSSSTGNEFIFPHYALLIKLASMAWELLSGNQS